MWSGTSRTDASRGSKVVEVGSSCGGVGGALVAGSSKGSWRRGYRAKMGDFSLLHSCKVA